MNVETTAQDKSDRGKRARRHVWRILWQQLLADASMRAPDAIRERVDAPDLDRSGSDVVLAFATCGEEERHFQ